MDSMEMHAVFGILIPFVVPRAGILAFLLLMENGRLKPWILEDQKVWMDHYAKKDLIRTTRGGLLSGALWIAAIALASWPALNLDSSMLSCLFTGHRLAAHR
ncbi:hypothetical protein D4T97_001875 [Siminovitchia acidinfaciens]|uniref:Uncharacterized protein n=2 Tax=Siminovitchia acidinfaciens TaxID=2321395 RepID=A0A429Y761_9BACI|nr:hypothetical protein D4T97_001875 [Siminovitchia acidinfaciens]